MKRLVIVSWVLLVYFDFILNFGNLNALQSVLRRRLPRTISGTSVPSNEQLCRSMDFACVFYFKRVLCLQRSAATTILLRRYGWDARMITGAQILPFRSHAWVEIEGRVVNDKPYMREIYQLLDQC
jgi:transglutaminase superfamily protein